MFALFLTVEFSFVKEFGSYLACIQHLKLKNPKSAY